MATTYRHSIPHGTEPRPVERSDWTAVYRIGPGTLAGRYLRRWWHPVYRADDLPADRAKPIRILGEDLTLYRGHSGAPYLVAFRCAHRGTQLSTGWVEGEHLRCFYHGWVYDGSGQCVEQPAEPEPFCQRIKIQSYPVRKYLGLVFAYLGEGEPPPFPRYPELEEEGVLQTSVYTWPCSYFSSLENGVDHGHVAFVHRESSAANGLIGMPLVAAEETEWGILHTATRSDGGERLICHQWPNVNQRKAGPPFPDIPWTETIAWRVPVDDTHFSTFGATLAHVTGELADRYRERIQAGEVGQSRGRAIEVAEAAMR